MTTYSFSIEISNYSALLWIVCTWQGLVWGQKNLSNGCLNSCEPINIFAQNITLLNFLTAFNFVNAAAINILAFKHLKFIIHACSTSFYLENSRFIC